jgi:hypothetical protein
MNDDKRSAVPKKIEESVRHTQAMTLAHNYLLAEIIGELADAARSRHDDLADMFERISAHADQLPTERQPYPMGDLFREELSKFFAQVAGVHRIHGR